MHMLRIMVQNMMSSIHDFQDERFYYLLQVFLANSIKLNVIKTFFFLESKLNFERHNIVEWPISWPFLVGSTKPWSWYKLPCVHHGTRMSPQKRKCISCFKTWWQHDMNFIIYKYWWLKECILNQFLLDIVEYMNLVSNHFQ